MTDPALRERAALDVLKLLPDGWRLGPASYDPGSRRWSITPRAEPTGMRSRTSETEGFDGRNRLSPTCWTHGRSTGTEPSTDS